MYSVHAGLLPVLPLSIASGYYLAMEIEDNPVGHPAHSLQYTMSYIPNLSNQQYYILVVRPKMLVVTLSHVNYPSIKKLTRVPIEKTIRFKPKNTVDFNSNLHVSLGEITSIKKEYNYGTIFIKDDE